MKATVSGLLADDCLDAEGGDQGETLGVLGAGFGGVDHDAQGAAGHGEDVAVEGDNADVRVVDRLAGGFVVTGDAGVSQLGEAVTSDAQFSDQPVDPLVDRVTGGGPTQVRDQGALQRLHRLDGHRSRLRRGCPRRGRSRVASAPGLQTLRSSGGR
ncbi:hypothetical protein O7614_17250 [Micromonospora sp. WMMD961]|uniref:hypothetical protein n=1 Tax=Micromonospora sp. WMMD961 TaxID=3016100 RepID=UPI0024163B21|nr:hypothetical protein [Micromonospora sp. WMMD961]MDG4781400.1 hypothetical protein [Micromonospora sp. WMMD961]